MKLFKAMATVAGLTGLSRIAGFVRDILTASILGAGPVADAFFVALKLPNLFRRVTAEGAFSVAFVPLYSEALEKDGREDADRFASNAFAVMLWGLLGLTALALLAMPWIIYVIAPGFQEDGQRYDLAVELSRVTFPYLLLMSLTALMGGVLNAHERFAPFAAAPIFFNLSLIVALLLAGGFETPGHAMAWGVLAAGFVQFALLFVFIRRHKVALRLVKPQLTGRIRRLFKLMGPGVIGAGVMHVNLLADLIIASFLATGSISYLYYADRLNQLPLGMVGIAVGTALLPLLSKAIAGGDMREANHLFNRALEVCMLLALPAAVGLFTASLPIIVTLFQHGAFSFEDAGMTTAVLCAYALGMPAYIAVKVYSTAYWSRQDTLTPVKASVASTLFNIGISLYLVMIANVGVVGIAVGTAMAGWLQIALLAWGLKGQDVARLDERFKKSFLKIVGACAILAAYLILMKGPLRGIYVHNDALYPQILALVALIGGGIIIYGLAVTFSGVIKIHDIKRLLKRD
ncbi:MAG: murein biosynthesis integral membrane protein MurJ [Rhodospirillales bacterium]|nr:murein biosynthesis integral membrane protein MurJ [Rhodospirillales bacterium]MCB9995420.1 murein biosynthesis integral membrane protein MurJ [Rhodospirillales bacterium]